MSRKILAFGGSSSRQSINKKLAVYTAGLFSNATVEVIDLNDFELPVFSVDKEAHIPELVFQFAKKIDECDLIVLSLAEHNGSYSAAFKNIFDWTSRLPQRKVFADKKIFLMATSPGARGGSSVLETATKLFPFSGGIVVSSFSLPSFHQNFKEGVGITNEDLKKQLQDLVQKTAF
jgi:chromate reductase